MFSPFPEDEAFKICSKIIDALQSGLAEIQNLTQISSERKDNGLMIGSAVCSDSEKNQIILYTVSGISKKIVFKENKIFGGEKFIFVEPIVDSSKINEALEKNDLQIHLLTEKIKKLKESRLLPCGKFSDQSDEEKNLISEREKLTIESLLKVFSLYIFHSFDGSSFSLLPPDFDISKDRLCPTGTGDCCAPKLLDFAFKNKLVVLSLCEVFYGKSTSTKQNGKIYPPCDERCSFLLPKMLGLEILYRDEHIIVVNKQSGLLSVPGRLPEKKDCIVNRVKRLFPDCIEQPSVHRLDMETSGLLVLAFTKDAHRELNRQFENKEVYKEYEAILDGKVPSQSGMLELYFRVDLDNRPHQKWDSINGKKAVTEYKNLGFFKYNSPDKTVHSVTKMLFIPHTGRTHQLRLASADIHGLNIPIVGDTLYGKCLEGERLLLHAIKLEFIHPITKQKMSFENKIDWKKYGIF